MKSNKTAIAHQLRALAIYDFLNTYNKLEKQIRFCFEETLDELSTTMINKLYFYYGGRIGSFIDYENKELRFNYLKYKENESFKELSVNQILKINKEECFVEKFLNPIDSIQRKMINYNCVDCMIKILEMRNVLAHEIENVSFKEKHIIETLSKDNIIKNIQIDGSFDLNLLDEVSLQIYSNVVYMKLILSVLE